MRILVAMKRALQAEGIAHLLREALPEAVVVLSDKEHLVGIAESTNALTAVVVAHPWISQATLRALHRRHPAAVLIIYSSHDDAVAQRSLLAANIAAIVADDAPAHIVCSAVHVALFGRASVQARCLRISGDVKAESSRGSRRIGELNLTPRQFDVLRLVASRRANKQIADSLGIGLRTVKGHVAVILRALHAANRVEAGRRARRYFARNEMCFVSSPRQPGTGRRGAGIGIR